MYFFLFFTNHNYFVSRNQRIQFPRPAHSSLGLPQRGIPGMCRRSCPIPHVSRRHGSTGPSAPSASQPFTVLFHTTPRSGKVFIPEHLVEFGTLSPINKLCQPVHRKFNVFHGSHYATTTFQPIGSPQHIFP